MKLLRGKTLHRSGRECGTERSWPSTSLAFGSPALIYREVQTRA
jgi:hypothetical protein